MAAENCRFEHRRAQSHTHSSLPLFRVGVYAMNVYGCVYCAHGFGYTYRILAWPLRQLHHFYNILACSRCLLAIRLFGFYTCYFVIYNHLSSMIEVKAVHETKRKKHFIHISSRTLFDPSNNLLFLVCEHGGMQSKTKRWKKNHVQNGKVNELRN